MNRLQRQKIIDRFIKHHPDKKNDKFIYRSDEDTIEWICKHGIGHPIWDSQKLYVHGCDGCCKKIKRMI